MSIKSYLIIYCSLISIFSYTNLHSQVRNKVSLNSHWQFHKGTFDVNSIQKEPFKGAIVNIPHTWNDKDVLPDNDRGYYRGEGWYFKPLEVSFDTKEKNYYLQFEGANQYTEVYVNHQKVGNHSGGYSAFIFNITPYLKENDNSILVKVDNSHNTDIAPLSADFTFFGGIYRDVFLIETSKTHFNLMDYGSKGIYVSTPKVNENVASIKIKGSISNESRKRKKIKISYKVIDKDKKNVTEKHQNLSLKATGINTFETEFSLKDPKLWSPENPHLYSVEITLTEKGVLLDEEIITFGIRTFHFDAKKGFFLNDEPLKLIGANRHQDYQGKGTALSDEQHRSDLQLLKDMGGNFLRLAHYPQDPAVLDEADRLGLLIWEETPLVNEVTISKAHDQNAEIMLKEMIRQHYNHPSVILWGYMNEIYWAHRFLEDSIVESHTQATLDLAKKLEKTAREEDPTRYTAMALHNYPLYETSKIDMLPQVVGWNLYHGWYYDTYKDFGKFMDEQHRKYPDRVHIISEYGAGSDPRLHSTNPERFDFTVEGHKAMMESFLKQIMERPYIAGSAVWNLIDFSSERRIDTNPHLNNKGLVTSDRTPKDPYFWYQANLLKEPYLKIAETNWTERTAYPSDENSVVALPVQIYSNLDEVELFLDNASLGSKKIKDKKATWNVQFKSGKNKFLAKGIGENETVTDYLTINYKEIPFQLSKESYVDISINSGSNHSFYDELGKNTWVVDKPYQKGSWGYIEGEPLYVSKKIGTKEDILTVNEFVPLYQTMREGIEAYKFDVNDGWYEVELLFVEPFPKSRRFVDGIESPDHEGGLRIFDVTVNSQKVFDKLDLLKTYGYNYPVRKKIIIKVKNNEGIHIMFNALKGKPVVSGIKIRSVH